MAKIRKGFVSNSSTSSFILFGVELDESYFKSILKELKENKDLKYDWKYAYAINELIDATYCCDSSLDVKHLYNGGEYKHYIGIDPNYLDLKLTLEEHKEIICKEINKFTDKEVKPKEIEFIYETYQEY